LPQKFCCELTALEGQGMGQERVRTVRPAPQLMTFAEAGSLASNSPAWWRKLATRQHIPVVKLGRSSRLREEDVTRIIAEGFCPAREVQR
jgi:hypothetical protein